MGEELGDLLSRGLIKASRIDIKMPVALSKVHKVANAFVRSNTVAFGFGSRVGGNTYVRLSYDSAGTPKSEQTVIQLASGDAECFDVSRSCLSIELEVKFRDNRGFGMLYLLLRCEFSQVASFLSERFRRLKLAKGCDSSSLATLKSIWFTHHKIVDIITIIKMWDYKSRGEGGVVIEHAGNGGLIRCFKGKTSSSRYYKVPEGPIRPKDWDLPQVNWIGWIVQVMLLNTDSGVLKLNLADLLSFRYENSITKQKKYKLKLSALAFLKKAGVKILSDSGCSGNINIAVVNFVAHRRQVACSTEPFIFSVGTCVAKTHKEKLPNIVDLLLMETGR